MMTEKLATTKIIADHGIMRHFQDDKKRACAIEVQWCVADKLVAEAYVTITNRGGIMVESGGWRAGKSYHHEIDVATKEAKKLPRLSPECPLCGHFAEVSTFSDFIICNHCELAGPRGDSKHEAIERWNNLVDLIKRGQHGT